MKKGFSLIELVMVIVIAGILSAVAVPKYFDLQDKAKLAAENGVVGGVRSGIYTYFTSNKVYPVTLDAASNIDCAIGNICFDTILQQNGITSGWTKTASLNYQGPAGNNYIYKPSDGSFLMAGAPVGTTLSYNTFDTGSSGWTTTIGNAIVQGGQFVFGPSAEARSFTGDAAWSDYTIDTDVNLLSGSGYGVFFRVSNSASLTGYSFQYDPNWSGGTFIMRKWLNGHEFAPFAQVSAPAGFVWLGSSRHIKVDVSGSIFSASIDGQQVLTGTDTAYATGKVGLRTWSSSVANFDNFQVNGA